MISVTSIDNKIFIKIASCEYEQEMFHFLYVRILVALVNYGAFQDLTIC